MGKVLIYSKKCEKMVVVGIANDGDNAYLNLSENEKDAILFDSDIYAHEFLESFNISVEFFGTRPPRRPR